MYSVPGLGAGRLPEPLIDADKKPENRVLEEKSVNTTKDPVEEAKKAHSLETQKRKAKKEEFLQSLNETQLEKIDELHADHNQEGKQGPITPEHHADMKLEGKRTFLHLRSSESVKVIFCNIKMGLSSFQGSQ